MTVTDLTECSLDVLSVRTWHITEEVVCCADSFVIADTWILDSLTFALWSWLAVRSAVRDKFVGTVLKDISFSITKHGGQWNALNTLFFVAHSADTSRTWSGGRVDIWCRVAV